MRKSAVQALGKLDDKKAVEPLRIVLKNDKDQARWLAALGLFRLGDLSVVKELIQYLLNADNSETRIEVITTLGSFGDVKAVDSIIYMLGHFNPKIRTRAAKALDELGEQKWSGVIQGDEYDISRLSELDDKRIVAPMTSFLVNQDDEVRKTAAKALKTLGEPEWTKIIKGEMRDFIRLAKAGDSRVEYTLLGKELLPVANAILTPISGLLKGFSEMSPAAKSTILAFAGIAAAAGPVSKVTGQMLKSFGTLSQFWKQVEADGFINAIKGTTAAENQQAAAAARLNLAEAQHQQLIAQNQLANAQYALSSAQLSGNLTAEELTTLQNNIAVAQNNVMKANAATANAQVAVSATSAAAGEVFFTVFDSLGENAHTFRVNYDTGLSWVGNPLFPVYISEIPELQSTLDDKLSAAAGAVGTSNLGIITEITMASGDKIKYNNTDNTFRLSVSGCTEVQLAPVVFGTSASAPGGTYPKGTLYLTHEA